jgi:SAM-dependent methyltransferase
LETKAILTASACPENAGRLTLRLDIRAVCLFRPVIRCQLSGPRGASGQDSHQAGWYFHWLPRGQYEFFLDLPINEAGDYTVDLAWGTPEEVRAVDVSIGLAGKLPFNASAAEWRWEMHADTAQRIAALPWQGGHNNWFFRHFDHAATVICEQFLKNSPKLKGRILDVGAGDGITDLGILLRHQPQELVAVDIVDYLKELPTVARQHGLPLDALPDNLTFLQGSAATLPYPDGHFDLVLSWGSVEHIKDGYRPVLDEVWRVLKPGGLFFVNPGLYYAPYGSHLGEFFPEPHHHLKMSEEALHAHVLSAKPNRMDRSGFDAPNAEYWRFYKELNPICVADFERELKSYGYKIIRAALRVADMVEYDDSLQQHSLVDLAVEDAFFVLEKPGDIGQAGQAAKHSI